MDRRAASEHLEVIRTLMERSAVYRRALAPTLIMLGVLGMAAGVAGYFLEVASRITFAGYWMGVGVAGLGGAYWQMRRQALKEREPFWSPPTRRVTQALAPALLVGAIIGLPSVFVRDYSSSTIPSALFAAEPAWWLPVVWMLLYGCAVHAAGFFMPRGFKLFGWSYILAGCFVWVVLARLQSQVSLRWAHLLMGIVFGGAHLAYGVYLAITEKHKEEIL